MNFLRPLALLLPACILTGCVGYFDSWKYPYHCVRVTDPRGVLIADYLAEGYVLRTSTGYRFKAIERVSGPPFIQVTHYPHGRRIEASGPNITVTPCSGLHVEEHAVHVVDRSKD